MKAFQKANKAASILQWWIDLFHINVSLFWCFFCFFFNKCIPFFIHSNRILVCSIYTVQCLKDSSSVHSSSCVLVSVTSCIWSESTNYCPTHFQTNIPDPGSVWCESPLLLRLIKMHTVEKPFYCPDCPDKMPQKSVIVQISLIVFRFLFF